MYNNLLKQILFPSLSIYFFPSFFTFFPIPKSKFQRIMGKNGDFFYFENREFVSLSFHILFSPFLPILKSKFQCVLGKMGLDPPPPILLWQKCISVSTMRNQDCEKCSLAHRSRRIFIEKNKF